MPPTRSERLSHQIHTKTTQVRSQGLTVQDQNVLKDRLTFIWREPLIVSEASATRSRQMRSRNTYKKIQATSNHLFLAVVLAIPPTVCVSSDFQTVLNQLMRLDTYDTFLFQLDGKAKAFLESTAAEQGFATEQLYLNFMESMFSAPEDRREYISYLLPEI